MCCRSARQAAYLSAGILICRSLVLIIQPRMILDSLGFPSADSFSWAINCSRSTCSELEIGLVMVWVDRRTDAGAREMLRGVLIKVVTMSSMKTSDDPSGRGAGRSIVGKAGAYGRSSERNSAGAMRCWSGLDRVEASQAVLLQSSFAKSVISSLMGHHAWGHPAPPKDKRNCIYAYSSRRAIQRYADSPL